MERPIMDLAARLEAAAAIRLQHARQNHRSADSSGGLGTRLWQGLNVEASI